MKCEWIKEDLSLLSITHVVQHDPYVINLLESRSSFPNGACLHVSHVRLGKWDILSLTGHFSAPQLTALSHRCQPKPLLGHVEDQDFWVMSSQENPLPLSSLPALSHPSRGTALLQVSPALLRWHRTRTGTGVAVSRHWRRELLHEKFTKEQLCISVIYSFIKTGSLGRDVKESRDFYHGLVALESDPSSDFASTIY